MSPSKKKTTPSGASLSLILVAVIALGCDTGNQDDIDNDPEEEDTEKENGDSEGSELPYTTALIVTTDYASGAYATISLGDISQVEKDIKPIHSDSVCHFDPLTDTPFVLQRLGVDSVLELDPEDFDIENEFSVEANSNPHGMAVVADDRAYISRYGLAEMLVVDPFEGEESDTVDFSDYADDDGIPEISGLAKLGDKVYATVQRLDRDNYWEAVGGGLIAVLDAASGEIEKEVELTGTHSYGAPEYSAAMEKFVVAEPGSWSDLENAGVEYFDPEDESVSGFIITEQELGGNVTKALVVSQDKGYALVGVEGEAGSDTHIIAFNPETGEKLETILATEGWTYGDIALTPDGAELWVADRTAENDGVRTIDTETDEEKTDDPINVGLPPSNICFTR